METRPIFKQYCELLVPQREFKHSEFKRIDFEARHVLAKELHDVLAAHGGFLSAFYTPVHSFLAERVRVNMLLARQERAIPADPERLSELIQVAAEELKAERTGPGLSAAISDLLHTPISALLHFADFIDIRLKVIYDPREPREDRAVQAAMNRTAELTGNITPGTASRLVDVNVTSTSETEIGLQYADLAAGETRAFFDANRELREFGASPNLITSTSDEGNPGCWRPERQRVQVWRRYVHAGCTTAPLLLQGSRRTDRVH